ncbi:TPA: small multi-drug export protein [Candidatus Woesearchaeota archaeon]|nr:small multi-drug export protein [Candidatus Woesearchaeota archaeon]
MLNEILILVAITLLPFLELRASIPYGILKTDLHWMTVFVICVVTNAVLGPVIYFLIDKLLHLFLRWKRLEKVWKKTVEKTQKKIEAKVEKYGWIGVALFIGVPLPGSGVYSGAIGSYLLGLGYKKFILASILGVLIAGIAVTAIVLLGVNGAGLFVKMI